MDVRRGTDDQEPRQEPGEDQPDYARGQTEDDVQTEAPDFARGQRRDAMDRHEGDFAEGLDREQHRDRPDHGDFARGQRRADDPNRG